MMRTIEEIRHARLLELLRRPAYPTIQAFADKIGRSHAQVSQWKNRSKRASGGVATIESASARHIEQMVGEAMGWMDNDPDLLEIARDAPFSGELMSRLNNQPDSARAWIGAVVSLLLDSPQAWNPTVVQFPRRLEGGGCHLSGLLLLAALAGCATSEVTPMDGIP